MSGDPSYEGLGRWTASELPGSAESFAGAGTDSPLEPIQRFARNVARLARKRLFRSEVPARLDAMSIFVFQPDAPPEVSRERYLVGDGHIETAGNLWFTNALVSFGRKWSVVDATREESYFAVLDELGCSRSVIAVFNPSASVPIVTIYPEGLEFSVETLVIEITDARVITSQMIVEPIRRMANSALLTPGVQPKGTSVWMKAEDHWAHSDAEARVQERTQCTLLGSLWDCDIRLEQPGTMGRPDIEIQQIGASSSDRRQVAQMEIKVTRERGSTGTRYSDAENLGWIMSGVKQAAAYRTERGGDHAIMYCFDMRAEDQGDEKAFAHVRELAAQYGVETHRSYLYNSAAAGREGVLPPLPSA